MDSCKIPDWFEGKVYSKGGVVIVNNEEIKLDRNALSLYHLIQGYKIIGRKGHIQSIMGVEWFRDNYPTISLKLFPEGYTYKVFSRNYTEALRDMSYKIFSKKN